MEEDKKEKNGGKVVAIAMIILLLGVLAFSGYFIYQMTYTDNNGEDKIEEDEEELLYSLNVYKNNYSLCLEQTEYCKDIAFSIKTKTTDTKVLGFDNEFLFVLFKDSDELKIYNRKLNESQGILLEDLYKEYKLFTNELKDNIAGIVYKTNDNKIGYFNVLTGKKLYEGKYDSNNSSLIQINDNYLSVSLDNPKAYLLSAKEEKEMLEYEADGPSFVFASFGLNGKYMFALKSCAGDCFIEKIYTNDLKEIYSKNISDGQYDFINNSLYFNDNNKVSKIDLDGNISDFKSYNSVKGIVDNYVVFTENNKIKIENITSEEIKELGEFKDNYNYDIYMSGFYTRDELDMMEEKSKSEGYYVVINYSEKDSNGNYGIEYCYTSDGNIKTYEIKQEIGGRAKPVLYLYPKETINVEISFAHPDYLTTTYPKYNNGWKVVANPNGDLYDKFGKYYYGLYWDEIRYNEVDFHEGFYVEKEDAIEFLEDKLSLIGLNDRERNEFIMYWLPILESNKKSLVYFELTDEREFGNKLIINPTPDSMLRVSIHIKKVNEKVNIKEQVLKHFERNGFAAIEWGGMIY